MDDIVDCSVSLVLPVYNEEQVLAELFKRLQALLDEYDPKGLWEVTFVNDGSSDASSELIDAACHQRPRFKLINLSRNFGHQIAITAGLDHAEGDAVVIMDADLQDPPEVIREGRPDQELFSCGQRGAVPRSGQQPRRRRRD